MTRNEIRAEEPRSTCRYISPLILGPTTTPHVPHLDLSSAISKSGKKYDDQGRKSIQRAPHPFTPFPFCKIFIRLHRAPRTGVSKRKKDEVLQDSSGKAKYCQKFPPISIWSNRFKAAPGNGNHQTPQNALKQFHAPINKRVVLR